MQYRDRTDLGLELFKIVDISISHIKPSDDALLKSEVHSEKPKLIVYEKDCGYFIYVTCDRDYLDEILNNLHDMGFSEAFQSLYKKAFTSGAAWILIDSEGCTSKVLPDYVNTWK